MTIKEQLFCYYYAKLQNHKEAAIKSGYTSQEADKIGMKLLSKESVRIKIETILEEAKKNDFLQKSIMGLERLAFGSIVDAIKLIFAESIDDVENLSNLDLYNVSEIKKVKGGGFEIKFFDRCKALEKLIEISQVISGSNDASEFFDAIKMSAQAVSDQKEAAIEGDKIE